MKPMPAFIIIALLFITLFVILSKRSDPPASYFTLSRGLCTEVPCIFGADAMVSILPSLDPFVVYDGSPKAHYSANGRGDNNIYDTVDVVLYSPAQHKVTVPRAVTIEMPLDPSEVKLALYQRNEPIPIAHFRGWQANNPNIVGILNHTTANATESISTASNKTDIVPKLDSLTDSNDKNGAALSSSKSPTNGGPISSETEPTLCQRNYVAIPPKAHTHADMRKALANGWHVMFLCIVIFTQST